MCLLLVMPLSRTSCRTFFLSFPPLVVVVLLLSSTLRASPIAALTLVELCNESSRGFLSVHGRREAQRVAEREESGGTTSEEGDDESESGAAQSDG